MRVPPPYVPRLSGHIPDYGQGDWPPEPLTMISKTPGNAATSDPEQNRPSVAQHRFFVNLTIRERLLTAFFLMSLILISTIMPRSSVDAQQFNPSASGLQPVERPEDNFAGSAFYFIDPNYAIPQNYGEIGIDPLAEPGTGSIEGLTGLTQNNGNQATSAHVIRPVAFHGSAIDDSRALYCLAQAIYYEAGMEPDAGQRGVAQVILNRVRHPSYPNTVCGVVYQGSERQTGCQFTYTCDGSLRRKPTRFHWDRAKKVAAEALAGKSYTMVGTATHYHATYVYPYWAPSLRFVGTVGAHRFYSWKGNAGTAGAFSQKYRGGEPLPAPKTRRDDVARNYSAGSSLDPIALEKAYEAGRRKAEAEAAASDKWTALAADNARRHDQPVPTPDANKARSYQAPDYSREAKAKGGDQAFVGQKLPDMGQIKPEFRNSGSWKKKPGE